MEKAFGAPVVPQKRAVLFESALLPTRTVCAHAPTCMRKRMIAAGRPCGGDGAERKEKKGLEHRIRSPANTD